MSRKEKDSLSVLETQTKYVCIVYVCVQNVCVQNVYQRETQSRPMLSEYARKLSSLSLSRLNIVVLTMLMPCAACWS